MLARISVASSFLLAPDHDVLERVVDVVVAHQALVDGLGVVEQGDVEVGVERLDLVEVERGEQPVPPAERGVRVDEHVLVLVGVRGGSP